MPWMIVPLRTLLSQLDPRKSRKHPEFCITLDFYAHTWAPEFHDPGFVNAIEQALGNYRAAVANLNYSLDGVKAEIDKVYVEDMIESQPSALSPLPTAHRTGPYNKQESEPKRWASLQPSALALAERKGWTVLYALKTGVLSALPFFLSNNNNNHNHNHNNCDCYHNSDHKSDNNCDHKKCHPGKFHNNRAKKRQ
ncbi:hypothetical protein EDC01DRAFT_743843 [Geopyxis carbonaria]|nr:hypothetical protein EDC01DRAFT_743843 [Geopyxis carbonaria]